jgi:hypothetical protein
VGVEVSESGPADGGRLTIVSMRYEPAFGSFQIVFCLSFFSLSAAICGGGGSEKYRERVAGGRPTELCVEARGIPHLAKNERDVGHPSSVVGTESRHLIFWSETYGRAKSPYLSFPEPCQSLVNRRAGLLTPMGRCHTFTAICKILILTNF